jgi:hypothetical protein
MVLTAREPNHKVNPPMSVRGLLLKPRRWQKSELLPLTLITLFAAKQLVNW